MARLAKWLSVCLRSNCFWVRVCCSHLTFRHHACFEQGLPQHLGNYRVQIHHKSVSDMIKIQNPFLCVYMYFLISNSLSSNGSNLIYFLMQLGKVKKSESFLIVEPPSHVKYFVNKKSKVFFTKKYLFYCHTYILDCSLNLLLLQCLH